MSSYLPPSQDLPTFNASVFSDNFTPDQVDTKIKTLQTEMDAQQLKTTRIAFDSGANETTITGTTLDVDATLELPNHSDVDAVLTTANTNISTLQTKTTQLSYSSGNDNSTFGSQLVIQDTGDNTQSETGLAHQLRLITGTDNKTLVLGYDNSVDIGYINASKNLTTRNLCLQTRGSYVGIGLTNPSEKLDVNGNIKCTNLKTANYTDVDGTLTSIEDKTDFLEKSGDDLIIQTPSGANMHIHNSGNLYFDSSTLFIRSQNGASTYANFTSNGLNILTNPIKATTVNDGVNDWFIRIPIQCSLVKEITNSAGTTNIRLPKNIGNFSAGTSTAMVYLVNISRADGDWDAGDRPSYLGVLQVSTFAGKKVRLYTISGASNQISSIAIAYNVDQVELRVQLGTSFPTSCKITLTQIR